MADTANIYNRRDASLALGRGLTLWSVPMTSDAYETFGAARPDPWLIACDHASNRVPDAVAPGGLGLPEAEMARHIAWDIGALGVTRALVTVLGAAGIASRFSRLVIDPNRGERDPTLIMQVYDRTLIPGNRALGDPARRARIEGWYRPYHEAFAELAAAHPCPLVITVHSFTPRLQNGTQRPWDIGILYHHDHQSLSRPLVERLRREPDLVVGENEPYAGHLPGDTMDRHALRPGRPNALIEIRNDLIETPSQQEHWGQRLAPLLEAARKDANL